MRAHVQFLVPLCALFTLAQAARAQEFFEGSVTYLMSVPSGVSLEMVQHVKGEDIRVDMNMENRSVSIITDRQDTRQIFLVHISKQWLDVHAMQKRIATLLPGMIKELSSEDVSPAALDIRATGEKETIAGYECEHYTFAVGNNNVDVCAAKRLGWYFATPAPSGGMLETGAGARLGGPAGTRRLPGFSNARLAQWRERFPDGFFPLKISVRGERPVTLVVTGLEKKPLAATLFQTPAAYSEMHLGGRN